MKNKYLSKKSMAELCSLKNILIPLLLLFACKGFGQMGNPSAIRGGSSNRHATAANIAAATNRFATVYPSFTNSGWSPRAPMPGGRWAFASAGVNSGANEVNLFAIAGYDASFADTALNQEFSALGNSWVNKAASPLLRNQISAQMVANKIYVPGGYGSSFSATSQLSIYDIATDTWTTGASMPVAVGDYAIGSYNDQYIYVIGGYTGSADTNTVQVYSIATNTWTIAPSKPGTATAGLRGGIANGKIVVGGGFNQGLSAEVSEAAIGQINPSNPFDINWTSLPAMPYGALGRGSAGAFDDHVYFSGGDPTGQSGQATNFTYAYNVTLGRWEVGPSKPTPVSNVNNLSAVTLFGRNYMVALGGYDGSNVVNVNEWLDITNPPGAALNFDGVDDYVSIPNTTSASFTLEADIKTSTPSLTGTFAFEGSPILWSDIGGGADDFTLAVLNNTISFYDGNSDQNTAGTIDVVDGAWHHITVVRKAGGSVLIYVDGVLDATGVSGSAALTANPVIEIGGNSLDSRYFQGSIDEVRIFDRALCEAEIQNNMSCEISSPVNGLAANYHFNQGFADQPNSSVTTLTDSSGNGNNGSLNNMALTGSASNWTLQGGVTTGNSCAPFVIADPATIICAADQTADTDLGACTAVVSYSDPTVTGTPAPVVTYVFSGATTASGTGSGSGSAFKTGLTTVTLTAANDCSTASCSFTVTVSDTTAPVFTVCPSDSSVNTDPGVCGAIVNYAAPKATDNCGITPNVLLIWDEMDDNTTSLQNSLIAAGDTVTLSATDGTQYDGTNPPLAGFDAVIHLNGTTYNQGMPSNGQSALVDFVLNQGKTYIENEWAAYDVDETGQLAAMSEIVVLNRQSGFTEPDTYTVVPGQENHPLMSGVPATFTLPNGGGNIGGVRSYATNQPVVVMTGNHGAAVAIRNFPNGGRAIGFAHAGNYFGYSILSDINVQKLYANAVGPNGITMVQTSGLASGSTFPVGVTTNSFTATDMSGNSATCTHTVTVIDNENPTITPAGTVYAVTNQPNMATGVDLGTPTTADNCSVATVTNDHPSADYMIGTTTVTWTVTDVNGNTTTATQTVIVTDLLIASADGQTNVSCHGGSDGSATVFASGGSGSYTYSWSPSGGTDATASNLAAGTYTVTVTDANYNWYTADQSFTITEPDALVASADGQTDVACHGGSDGSATVAVTGGSGNYNYSWSPSGGTDAMATGLSAGTYTVTVADANATGCTTTQSFTIAEPDALVASADGQTDVACHGGSDGSATVAVTGGSGNYNYSWSPSGGTDATATGLSAGTYTVTVEDANAAGCTTTQSFTIAEPDALVASADGQTDVACHGGSDGSATVAVTGGSGNYNYSWSPSGGTDAMATGLSAGTYTVTVEDANVAGCTTTQSFTIAEPDALVASVDGQTDVACHGGSDGTATVAVTGGSGNYNYSWSPSGGTDATATGLSAGTYTVTVADANAAGCTTTQSFTIAEPDALVASADGQTDVSCHGMSNGTATVAVTGGSGNYNYSWSPSGGTDATATGLSAGTYTVTVEDANAAGCTTTQSFTIAEPDAITATTTSQTDATCNGGNDGSATVSPSGGTGNYSYSWSPSGGTADTATGLSAGTYIVTISDENSCAYSHTVVINEPDAVTVDSQPSDDNIASTDNASFSVTTTNAVTFLWQVSTDGGATWSDVVDGGASPSYSGADTTTLTLTGVLADSNGNLYHLLASNGTCPAVVSNSALLTVVDAIEANDDDFSATVIYDDAGGIAGNVLTNDTINGAPASTPAVTITIINDGGLTGAMITAAGDLIIPALSTAGNYTLTYSLCETPGMTNCDIATVLVTITPALAVNGFENSAISVYPNPTVDVVFINVPGSSSYKNLKVAVYDMTGKLIMTEALNSDSSSVDLSRLSSDVYLFKITSDTNNLVKLIVKK